MRSCAVLCIAKQEAVSAVSADAGQVIRGTVYLHSAAQPTLTPAAARLDTHTL